MKLEEHDQLLKQVLADDEIEACRRATLDCGIAALRIRRVRRQRFRSALLSCLLILALGLLLKSFVPQSPPSKIRTSRVASSDQKVKIISDDELFALFPDRPLALVGKPGRQQLLFLDQFDNSTRTVSR